jgi:hypothetical protein
MWLCSAIRVPEGAPRPDEHLALQPVARAATPDESGATPQRGAILAQVIRGSAFAALLAAVPAWADGLQTPALVNDSAVNQCSVRTCAATYSQPVAAGDMLIAAVYVAGSTVTQVTDSQGNPWTLAVRQPRATMPSSTELWFIDGGSAPGADTVTVLAASDPPSGQFLEVHLYEYSGLLPRGPDCTASSDATAPLADSGPCQTHSATELLFGMANPHTPVVGAGPGFTLRQTTNCDWDEDRVVTSTGSYDALFQLNGSGDVATVLGAFAAAPTSSAEQPLKGWPLGCSAGANGPACCLALIALFSGCRVARGAGRSGCDPLRQRARQRRRFLRRGREPLGGSGARTCASRTHAPP